MNKPTYIVWCGGVEINDYEITDKMKAYYLAEYWDSMGYDDVSVEEIVPSHTPHKVTTESGH